MILDNEYLGYELEYSMQDIWIIMIKLVNNITLKKKLSRQITLHGYCYETVDHLHTNIVD